MYSARPSDGMKILADCAKAQRYPILWRGVRAAEGARLESVYTAKPRIEGSNPSLSAIGLFVRAALALAGFGCNGDLHAAFQW